MTEDFSTAPVSLAEVKADRDLDASKWTPRDALVQLLREIDSGETKVDVVFIALGEYADDGGVSTGFRAAGSDHWTIAGLAQRAMWKLNSDD
jgi:hypothetical protein